MNLDSFDYAAALAREHNFTRAARQLGITQQSLSAHIAGLEAELGCQLFRRGGALEITQAGAVFLCHAENVRREVETLRREVGDAVQNQRGVLRIGVAFTRGRAIMPELIARFQAQYPGVSVELFEAANQALQYDLQNKKIDLALANFPAAVPGVELCDFYREEVVLLLPKSLTPESGGKDKAAAQSRKTQAGRGDLSALAGCPFVLGGADNIAGRIGRSLIENAGFAPLVRAKSDNMETLLSLCVQGVGACFCPENLAKAVLSPAELARVQVLRLGAAAQYPIRFGWRKSSYHWEIVSEFIRIATASGIPER